MSSNPFKMVIWPNALISSSSRSLSALSDSTCVDLFLGVMYVLVWTYRCRFGYGCGCVLLCESLWLWVCLRVRERITATIIHGDHESLHEIRGQELRSWCWWCACIEEVVYLNDCARSLSELFTCPSHRSIVRSACDVPSECPDPKKVCCRSSSCKPGGNGRDVWL